ncbi:MAG: hypothetical protein ACREVG_04760, partial [Burkholderiales bacterium]
MVDAERPAGSVRESAAEQGDAAERGALDRFHEQAPECVREMNLRSRADTQLACPAWRYCGNYRDTSKPNESGSPRKIGASVLDTRINDRDIEHLHSFPDDRKEGVMRRIMSRKPDRVVKLAGRNDFEKTLLA